MGREDRIAEMMKMARELAGQAADFIHQPHILESFATSRIGRDGEKSPNDRSETGSPVDLRPLNTR
jgi:hypothetical protein